MSSGFTSLAGASLPEEMASGGSSAGRDRVNVELLAQRP